MSLLKKPPFEKPQQKTNKYLVLILLTENQPHPLIMLIHVVIQANGPIDAARLRRLPRQLGVLLFSLADILGRVLGLVVLGNALGQIALHILHLGVAAARGKEAAAAARVHLGRQVNRVVAPDVIDVKVGSVGREQEQDAEVAFGGRVVRGRLLLLVAEVGVAALA